jgi:hypothetical protein
MIPLNNVKLAATAARDRRWEDIFDSFDTGRSTF